MIPCGAIWSSMGYRVAPVAAAAAAAAVAADWDSVSAIRSTLPWI